MYTVQVTNAHGQTFSHTVYELAKEAVEPEELKRRILNAAATRFDLYRARRNRSPECYWMENHVKFDEDMKLLWSIDKRYAGMVREAVTKNSMHFAAEKLIKLMANHAVKEGLEDIEYNDTRLTRTIASIQSM